jgi:hypothetical protein
MAFSFAGMMFVVMQADSQEKAIPCHSSIAPAVRVGAVRVGAGKCVTALTAAPHGTAACTLTGRRSTRSLVMPSLHAGASARCGNVDAFPSG